MLRHASISAGIPSRPSPTFLGASRGEEVFTAFWEAGERRLGDSGRPIFLISQGSGSHHRQLANGVLMMEVKK